ncbi:hypothetical protein TNCV_1709811 [Trichonephila clavipes]|nr:hypothetical protein TNCV_1709811 [Trichonephila clavipes]
MSSSSFDHGSQLRGVKCSSIVPLSTCRQNDKRNLSHLCNDGLHGLRSDNCRSGSISDNNSVMKTHVA